MIESSKPQTYKSSFDVILSDQSTQTDANVCGEEVSVLMK